MEDDFLSYRVFDKEFNLAQPHNEERVTGIAGLEEQVALGNPQLIDDVREGDSIVFVKVLEHCDVGKIIWLTGHYWFLSSKKIQTAARRDLHKPD
jgi:hypothetical protein